MEIIKINPLGLRFYKSLVCLCGNYIHSNVFLDSFEIITNHKNHMTPVCPTKHVHMITFYTWVVKSSLHVCSKLWILVLAHVRIVCIWFPSCNPEQKRGEGEKVSTVFPFLGGNSVVKQGLGAESFPIFLFLLLFVYCSHHWSSICDMPGSTSLQETQKNNWLSPYLHLKLFRLSLLWL